MLAAEPGTGAPASSLFEDGDDLGILQSVMFFM